MMLLSALSVECVSTDAHLTSCCLNSSRRRAEEMITKMVEASVGAGGAARCFSTLCR